MLVKGDLRVEITEAMLPISHRLDVVGHQVTTARFERKVFNDRPLEHAQNRDMDSVCMCKFEADLAELHELCLYHQVAVAKLSIHLSR